MSLEASFRTLRDHLQLLHDELQELHRTVIEKPLKGDVVLVDLFSDAADDLLGWVAEASTAAREGTESSAYPVNLDRARESLKTCHERFISAFEKLSTDLLSYDRIAELTSLGQRRGGEWLAWANNVKNAVESCRAPSCEVNRTLFACWEEVSERIGATNISVQATNVGPHISFRGDDKASKGKTTVSRQDR